MSIQPINETIVNPELVTDITENHIIEPLRYNVHTDANNIKLPATMWGCTRITQKKQFLLKSVTLTMINVLCLLPPT